MAQMKRRSILCPNCNKLISADEPLCPYCNIVRPGSAFKNNPLVKGMSDARQLALYMIWINGGMYLISLLMSGAGIGLNMNPFSALSPSNDSLIILGATGTVPINEVHLAFDFIPRWWTLLSANYLHGSLLHILFNMLMFWQLAPLIVKEYGPYRMISIYTLGGVGGYLVSYLAGIHLTIGASAAVCSLVGSLLYFGKSRGGLYGQAVYKQVSGWVVSLFIFGLLVPGINNWGHGGGIVSGIAIGWWLGYNDKAREKVFHKNMAVTCVVLTVCVLLWAVVTGVLFRFF